MSKLSKAIGVGVQTFQIRDFDQHFSVVEELGPDWPNYLASRKIVKLIDEDLFYAWVGVSYKDIEEFVIRINDVTSINWKAIAETAERCRWRRPRRDLRYIN